MPSLSEVKSYIDLTRKEADDLIDYLKTLSDSQWRQPSACEGWSTADVVGHLIYAFKDVCYDRVSRTLNGDISPNEGLPPPGQELSEAALAKFIFDMGRKYKNEFGSDLLPVFQSYVDKVCSLWDTLTPDNWNTPCYTSGTVPAIVGSPYLLSIPYAACSMHHWDIRSRLHPETAYLSLESMPFFVGGVTTFHSFKPGPRLSSPRRYRFIVDDGIPLTLDFVIEGNKAHTEKSASSSPDVTFKCDITTLVLIGYGRLDMGKAINESMLTFTGDSQTAYQFTDWVGGV